MADQGWGAGWTEVLLTLGWKEAVRSWVETRASLAPVDPFLPTLGWSLI